MADDFIYGLAIGACFMAGMKVVDWVVPSPDKRIVVCMNSDTGNGICKTLADIDKAHKANRPAFTKDQP